MKTKFIATILLMLIIKSDIYAQPLDNLESSNILVHDQAKHFNTLDSSLSYRLLYEGLKGYHNLLQKDNKMKPEYLTLIDFSQPSTKERLFLLDMKAQVIVLKCLVAHGKKSGELYAEYFSDINGSHQSSLGFYKTLEVYSGSHGMSLRLEGLDKGYNRNAKKRFIVLHSAPYVSLEWMREKKARRIGRSWGCPAVPEVYLSSIINKVKDGTYLFIYAANQKYSDTSNFLQ